MGDAPWSPVSRLDDLPEDKATRAALDGTAVLLYRTGERVFAIGARCSHQGAPLDRGAVRISGSVASVTCPAHGSVFSLEDGTVLRLPARDPVPAFEARVTDGVIELRPRS